jgi:hypothetical protein
MDYCGTSCLAMTERGACISHEVAGMIKRGVCNNEWVASPQAARNYGGGCVIASKTTQSTHEAL